MRAQRHIAQIARGRSQGAHREHRERRHQHGAGDQRGVQQTTVRPGHEALPEGQHCQHRQRSDHHRRLAERGAVLASNVLVGQEARVGVVDRQRAGDGRRVDQVGRGALLGGAQREAQPGLRGVQAEAYVVLVQGRLQPGDRHVVLGACAGPRQHATQLLVDLRARRQERVARGLTATRPGQGVVDRVGVHAAEQARRLIGGAYAGDGLADGLDTAAGVIHAAVGQRRE